MARRARSTSTAVRRRRAPTAACASPRPTARWASSACAIRRGRAPSAPSMSTRARAHRAAPTASAPAFPPTAPSTAPASPATPEPGTYQSYLFSFLSQVQFEFDLFRIVLIALSCLFIVHKN